MTPGHMKFRVAPAYLTLGEPRIDRDNLIIRDTVAMLANVEALGHGFQTDQRTLEIMLALARQYSLGIKMRFGHPGMSENAMGQQIARAKNFRLQDDKLVHDIHFIEQAAISPAFGNDPVEYLFQMAEERPEDVGESVVIDGEIVWTLPDGSEVDGYGERPENALTELPVIRPLTFYFVDVVGEPALTRDGLLASMFSASSAMYSEQAFALIDEFRSDYQISLDELPTKVDQVLARYLHSRGAKPGDSMSNDKTPKRTTGKKSFEEGVVGGGAAADTAPAAEDTTAQGMPAPAPEAEDESELDAALATAEETEATLADPDDEAETEDAEGETVPAEQYAQALARIDKLEQQVAQLIQLGTINASNNANLAQRVVALEAEPVVTERIGGAKALNTPRLPADLAALRKPTHVSNRVKAAQGKAGAVQAAAATDPALASLMASQARQGASAD